MTQEELKKKIIDGAVHWKFHTMDDLILNIVNEYAAEMCEEQRKICAESVEMEEIEGTDDTWKEVISLDSIIMAPSPIN